MAQVNTELTLSTTAIITLNDTAVRNLFQKLTGIIAMSDGWGKSFSNRRAIFGYGNSGTYVSMTNLVSNTGVVSADVAGVGTARYALAAAGYGTDKAIFGYGTSGAYVSMTNLVSNTGVVSADVTGVGTARYYLAAASYGV